MTERIRIILIDLLTINFAWVAYYAFRVRSGIAPLGVIPDFWTPMVLICGYWILIFFFFGLNLPRHATSRVDEFTTILQAVSIGCLILFFVIFLDDAAVGARMNSRMLIFVVLGNNGSYGWDRKIVL